MRLLRQFQRQDAVDHRDEVGGDGGLHSGDAYRGTEGVDGGDDVRLRRAGGRASGSWLRAFGPNGPAR